MDTIILTEKGVEQVIKNCEQDLKIIWGIK